MTIQCNICNNGHRTCPYQIVGVLKLTDFTIDFNFTSAPTYKRIRIYRELYDVNHRDFLDRSDILPFPFLAFHSLSSPCSVTLHHNHPKLFLHMPSYAFHSLNSQGLEGCLELYLNLVFPSLFTYPCPAKRSNVLPKIFQASISRKNMVSTHFTFVHGFHFKYPVLFVCNISIINSFKIPHLQIVYHEQYY